MTGRVIQVGTDITRNAEVLVARGTAHLESVTAAFDVWKASAKITADAEFEGRRVTFRLRVSEEPPLEEWSLAFADAVHAMRSALDALTWDLSHLDGATPSNPERIFFPVSKTKSAWKQAASSLRSMPPEVLDRLEYVQPFRDPFLKTGIILLDALHDLDIQAKHRGLLSASAQMDRGNFRFSARVKRGTTSRHVSEQRIELTDGAKVGYIEFSDEVYPLSDVLQVRIKPRIDARLRDGRMVDATLIAGGLPPAMRMCLDYILTGELDATPIDAFRNALEPRRPGGVFFGPEIRHAP